ncbi:MAG: hypothetical protein ACN2B6_08690 [Rickettsiales bacterium]
MNHPKPAPTGTPLTPAEKQSIVRFLGAVKKALQLDGLGANQSAEDKIVVENASKLLSLTGLGTQAMLSERMESDVKNGVISQDRRKEIAAAFENNDFYKIVGDAESKYHTPKKHCIGFPLREMYMERAAKVGLDSEATTYLSGLLDEFLPRVEQFSKNFKAVDADNFMAQWYRGKFTYHNSVFSDPDDIKTFKIFIAANMSHLGTIEHRLPPETILSAVGSLGDRLGAREQEIAAKEREDQQHRQERNAAAQEAKEQQERYAAEQRENEAKAALARARQEHEEHLAFMAEFQPYHKTPAAAGIYRELSHYAKGSSKNAKEAATMKHAIDSTIGAFDIRNNSVKTLGDIVFSKSSLLQTARAFDVEAQISTNGAKKQTDYPENTVVSKTTIERLKQLYTSSVGVRHIIDGMLENDTGIILLASLTRSPSRSKNYASFITKEQRILAAAQEKVDALQEPLKDFTEDDLKELADDPQVKTLRAAQEKLAETQRDIAHARKDLAKEIRLVVQGRRLKDIESADVPEIKESTDQDINVPETWKEAMGDEFHAEQPENQKYVRILSNSVPYKFIEIKRSAGLSTVTKMLAELRVECAQHETNMELIRKLGDEAGFQIVFGEEGTRLVHTEYGISASLEGKEADQTTALVDAQAAFEAKALQQQVLLEAAAKVGITIDGVDDDGRATGPIKLAHPECGEVTLAPRGYLSANGTTTIEGWLDQIQRKQTLPDIESLTEDQTPKEREKPIALNLDPKKTLIVFDANTLDTLSAPRNDNGRTWLDLIKCTARLPNVTVIIPSTIADWELRGMIATYDEDGRRDELEQQATHIREREAIDSFLSSASRATVHPDGKTDYQEGANKNIIIMDTPATRELYDHIREIQSEPNAQVRRERFHNEIYKNDEGEKAIDRILQGIPFDNPFVVISDDTRYFKHAPRTTGKGMPVAQASTSQYIRAESLAREPELRQMLKESDPVTFHRIIRDIDDHLSNKNDRMLTLHHNRAGMYENGKKGPAQKIEDVIEAGVSENRSNDGEKRGWVARTSTPPTRAQHR